MTTVVCKNVISNKMIHFDIFKRCFKIYSYENHFTYWKFCLYTRVQNVVTLLVLKGVWGRIKLQSQTLHAGMQ